MSKVKEIEKALRSVDGGLFQSVCDSFLFKQGYQDINPIGSVPGSDKTVKGTPDTYVTKKDGNYIMIEYTTQRDRLIKKIHDDLDKCLDESKTGIPLSEISEIIYCANSNISPEEHRDLVNICKKENVMFTFNGISKLSLSLFHRYPIIAKDYLGISIDTSQIVDIDDFINLYQKSPLSTPLDLELLHRDNEVEDIVRSINANNVIIISGPAGTGKSRIAIECCKLYTKNNTEFITKCIYNYGADLYDDIRTYFSDDGKYLIFVDDVNRVSGFELILQLLKEQTEKRKYKIICTVRDYAKQEVQNQIRDYGKTYLYQLPALDKEKVRDILKSEYNIKNPYYLDRILLVTNSNLRLSIMAAIVVDQTKTFDSLVNVSRIYDDYFNKMNEETQIFKDHELLVTACIIVFFRYVNRADHELMEAISSSFKINEDTFWESIVKLHNMEIIDVYKNDIVKITDQVLASYIFYIVLFKEKLIPFGSFLYNFFPKHQSKMTEAIYPLLNAFDGPGIIGIITEDINKMWNQFMDSGDYISLQALIETFWFVKETDTLLYIRDIIYKMDAIEINKKEIDYKPDPNYSNLPMLNVLRKFYVSSKIENINISIELLLENGRKKHEEIPYIVNILTECYGYRHDSNLNGFMITNILIDVLRNQCLKPNDEIFNNILLSVFTQLLKTEFHASEATDKHSFTTYRFYLPIESDIINSQRQRIWDTIFELLTRKENQNLIVNFFNNYIDNGIHEVTSKLYKFDSDIIIPFLIENLDNKKYNEVRLFHKYLDWLDLVNIEYNKDYRSELTNELFEISTVMITDAIERRNLDLSYDEFGKLIIDRLTEYIKDFTSKDYGNFVDNIEELVGLTTNPNQLHQIGTSFITILEIICENNVDDFINTLSNYLNKGDFLQINPHRIIYKFMNISDANKTLDFIDDFKFSRKSLWFFSVFEQIDESNVSKEYVDKIYQLFNNADENDIPYGLDFLLKFKKFDKYIFTSVIRIMLDKFGEEPSRIMAISMIFNPHTEIYKNIEKLFKNEVELFKELYYTFLKMDKYGDHKGSVFSIIVDMDGNFIKEFIEWQYSEVTSLSKYDDTRDYSKLWLKENYSELMTIVIDSILIADKPRFFRGFSYISVFFKIHDSNNDKDAIIKRQDSLLSEIIDSKNTDGKYMELVFDLISEFSDERRQHHFVTFLGKNKELDIFKLLPLFPDLGSFSGSAEPLLVERIHNLELLLELLDSKEFLDHRKYVEDQIESTKRWIESERQSSFIGYS